MALPFPEGTTALATDSELRSLQKICELVASGGGGGGAGLTYYQGAGLDPNGVQSGSVGDVYHSKVSLGGDGSTWWKVSGTGTTTVWE